MAEARAVKFSTQRDDIKSCQSDDKLFPKEASYVHVTHLCMRNCGLKKNFATAHR